MQSGDPVKQIHWKSSAKGMGLMVKTFEDELSGRITILMDAGSSADPKTLDDCVRATGSLIFAALDAGHHVEWYNLGEKTLKLIPPFSDGDEILDHLARVQPSSDSLTTASFNEALQRISTKSAVSFVLTTWNEAVAECAAELRGKHRSVSVYLPAKFAKPAEIERCYVYSDSHIEECV